MPVEAKPLFRPDVLRPHLTAFHLPERVESVRGKLAHWAGLLSSGRADAFKEQEILPDFLTDFFCGLLGYTRPADGGEHYTISREKHVEVDGKFADAVLTVTPEPPDDLSVRSSSRTVLRRMCCSIARSSIRANVIERFSLYAWDGQKDPQQLAETKSKRELEGQNIKRPA